MPRGNSKILYRRLTPGRERWLRKLAAGPAKGGMSFGRAPSECRDLGWCEPTGEFGQYRLTPKGLAQIRNDNDQIQPEKVIA